tara:strand:- start:187 stop:540 length:354 start_codon:yes stop_codon:yes gene_type:complete
MQDKPFKYDEIKDHFYDWLEDQDPEWIKQRIQGSYADDIHHYSFNENYFIIGRHQAIQWLSDEVFHVIQIIKEYENFNFGEVTTDFSEPEKVVNMYAYIVGEEVVLDWKESLNYEEE